MSALSRRSDNTSDEKPTENFEHVPDKSDAAFSDSGEISWTEDEEKAIRRKVDIRIVPLATLLYLLCFLDRANIGNARIEGMGRDLALHGVRFNWALSIFYILYLLVEIPSNMILTRVGPRFYLPLLVAGFGLVSLCTAFVTSFRGLLAARAFLGVFEGGAMPGIAYFLSCFYKRNELLFRIGIFISASGMAGAFGGLLAAALSRIPEWGADSMRIHTWRNIFFFEGLFTVLVGIAAPVWMPQSAGTAYFLTPREREIATQRLVRERNENPQERVNREHVKHAFLSFNNYVCGFGFFFCNITVQGLGVFLPTILADLRWTTTKAQLLTVPPNALASLVAIVMSYYSDKTRNRGVFLACLSLVAITGLSVMRWSPGPYIRYMGVFFTMMGAGPLGPGFLGWAMSNSAGPSVRAVSSAYVVTLGTFGGLVATWTYLARDAPEYHTGHTINLAGQCASVLITLSGIGHCFHENRMRASGKRDNRLEGLTEAEQAKLGDKHPDFRYML